MTDDTAPSGEVLVKYLEPFFGGYSLSYAIGYYDNSNSYTEDCGQGWLHWATDNPINVVAYCELSELNESDNPFHGMSQQDILKRCGNYHPNKGNVGK